MCRASRILLPLFASLLLSTGAWAASVSQNIRTTITSTTQKISFSPTSLTFASQEIGTTSPAKTVTVTNTGQVSFAISSIATTGTAASDFAETNNCPKSLAVGAYCKFSVSFMPRAAGTRTASVVVTATGGATYTVSLSGTGTASPSGTTVPPNPQIVDNSGNLFTTSGQQIYRNGVVDPITGGVTLLLWYNSSLYQVTSSGNWYQLNTTNWPAGGSGWTYLASGDPQPPSVSGTTIPSATELVDASGGIFTVVGGQISRNGIVDPVTANVTLVLYYNGAIYQKNSAGNWYQLTSTTWPAGSSGWTYLASGDPRTLCQGVAVTPASGIQNAVNANPAGTTFCLAAGIYHEHVTPNNNDTFIGVGIGQTILDGQNSLSNGFGGNGDPHFGVTVSQMTIQNYTDSAIRFGCVNPAYTITYNEISSNNYGIETCGNGGIIQNNLIHDNAVNGIDCVNHTNLIIDNNDMYHNDPSQTSASTSTGQASNVKCINGSYTFTNNKIHDSWNNGLWFDLGTTGTTISGNEIYNMKQGCINGPCGGGTAIAFEVTQPYWNTTSSPKFYVHDNYIHDNDNGGIGIANSGNIEIYNNSFANNATSVNTGAALELFDEGYRTDLSYCVSIGCLDNNNSFHDNFVAVPAGQLALYASDGGTPGANWKENNNTFANNIYYLSGGSAIAWDADGSALTSSQWKAFSCCGSDPDGGSTFTINGGVLAAGVGPRGGFVCPVGMTCP